MGMDVLYMAVYQREMVIWVRGNKYLYIIGSIDVTFGFVLLFVSDSEDAIWHKRKKKKYLCITV